MIQPIKICNHTKYNLYPNQNTKRFGPHSELLKIHKILTPEETMEVLAHEKSFFDTNYEYFYDELNEIVNGKMPNSLKSRIDIFERETGIKLHVDNNLDDKKFGYAMNALYRFYDTNKIKGYEMPKDIYITGFLEKDLGGLYDGDSEIMYICPTYPESYEKFLKNLHHENMHHRDRDRLTQGINYFKKYSSIREKTSVGKILRPYATHTRSEFCACLAEKIENGELYVVRNNEGNIYLRKYIDSENEIKQEDLEAVARLYRKLNCPNFTPTEPPKTYLPYIEAFLN